MLPPRMKTDIILATIAGMAESLDNSFPELYLQAVNESASKTLERWRYNQLTGKAAKRYLKRIERELNRIESALNFKGMSMAGIINFWLCLVEYLNEEAKKKRDNHLEELRGLLIDYIDNLNLHDGVVIDQGIELCEIVRERLES